MDPEVTLIEIRKHCVRLLDGNLPSAEAASAGYRLAELITALDDWLRRGGGKPKDWSWPERRQA